METQREIQKSMTVYKIDTIDVDGKPEVQFKCLKRLVGERGFEPPTPWSRTSRSLRSACPSLLEGQAPVEMTGFVAAFAFAVATFVVGPSSSRRA